MVPSTIAAKGLTVLFEIKSEVFMERLRLGGRRGGIGMPGRGKQWRVVMEHNKIKQQGYENYIITEQIHIEKRVL
jgi:hypothetical protein